MTWGRAKTDQWPLESETFLPLAGVMSRMRLPANLSHYVPQLAGGNEPNVLTCKSLALRSPRLRGVRGEEIGNAIVLLQPGACVESHENLTSLYRYSCAFSAAKSVVLQSGLLNVTRLLRCRYRAGVFVHRIGCFSGMKYPSFALYNNKLC